MTHEAEICTACGHDLDEHYTSVRGVAVCRHRDQGESTSGVLGIPWVHDCDCRNYVSPQTARWRDEKAKEEREREEEMQRFVEKLEFGGTLGVGRKSKGSR